MELRYRPVGSSPIIHEIEQEIEWAARSDGKVLITGETGVGKGMGKFSGRGRSPEGGSFANADIRCGRSKLSSEKSSIVDQPRAFS
jgi:hypothetical protein